MSTISPEETKGLQWSGHEEKLYHHTLFSALEKHLDAGSVALIASYARPHVTYVTVKTPTEAYREGGDTPQRFAVLGTMEELGIGELGDDVDIVVKIEWQDQGWGNHKGRLFLMMSKHSVADVDALRLCFHATGRRATALIRRSGLPFKPRPGEKLELWNGVGGGGGHSLLIHSLRLAIVRRNAPTSAVAALLLEDIAADPVGIRQFVASKETMSSHDEADEEEEGGAENDDAGRKKKDGKMMGAFKGAMSRVREVFQGRSAESAKPSQPKKKAEEPTNRCTRGNDSNMAHAAGECRDEYKHMMYECAVQISQSAPENEDWSWIEDALDMKDGEVDKAGVMVKWTETKPRRLNQHQGRNGNRFN